MLRMLRIPFPLFADVAFPIEMIFFPNCSTVIQGVPRFVASACRWSQVLLGAHKDLSAVRGVASP
jgi:hypothetical protein